MRKLALVVAALAVCGGAWAQTTTQELKKALDDAMRTIQDLQARVKALEEQKAQAPGAAASAPARATAAAPVVAPGVIAEEGAKEPGHARAEIYGQVMADAIYDFRKMNPEWAATLRP